MRGSIASLSIMIGVLVSPAIAQTVDHYEIQAIQIVDLGTLGGSSSSGEGINDLGDVVGSAQGASGKIQAFIHADGEMLSLHGPTPEFYQAKAYDINNSREVVGRIELNGNGGEQPFYYYPGIWLTTISNDASFPMGHTWNAVAYAINRNGRIVGKAERIPQAGETPPTDPTYKACYDQLPVRWGDATTLPWPIFCITDPDSDHHSGQAFANDVNDSDSIVGYDNRTSVWSMFLYKNDVRYNVPPPAGLPTTMSAGVNADGVANGVNNKNHVVGEYFYREIGDPVLRARAFFWDGVSGKSVNLGVLSNGTDSRARKLNEADVVVGEAVWKAAPTKLITSGFIWHADFGMVQLPPLAYQPGPSSWLPRDCHAAAINEIKFMQVQVAGTCMNASGKAHAVRWDVKIQTYYNH